MRESRKLFVYGAGGHAKSVIGVIEHEAKWDLVGVVDGDALTETVLGYPVLGGFDSLDQLLQAGVTRAHVAIGDNQLRMASVRLLQDADVTIERVIHPAAVIMKGSSLGAGSFYHACSVIGPEAQIGDYSLISAHATVGHESELGEGVHLSPNAQLGGRVKIGNHCTLGLGAAVLPGVIIGHNTVVGANSVVTRDLPSNVVAVGAPARIVSQNPGDRTDSVAA